MNTTDIAPSFDGPAVDYDGIPYDIDDLVGEELPGDPFTVDVDFDGFDIEPDLDDAMALATLTSEMLADAVLTGEISVAGGGGGPIYTVSRWAPAKSITALRNEINARWPKRDRTSDGIIGNAEHSSRDSDHNPDSRGLVHAMDIDKDGIDEKVVLAALIGDQRVYYVIFRGVIYSRTYGWRARKYTGPNHHDHHIHVSIRYGSRYENDVSTWLTPVKTRTTGGTTSSNSRVIDISAVRNQFARSKAGRSVQKRADIAAVQKMLNKRPRQQRPGAALRVDGRVTADDVAAIRGMERALWGKGDGVPDPNGTLLRYLFKDARVKTIFKD